MAIIHDRSHVLVGEGVRGGSATRGMLAGQPAQHEATQRGRVVPRAEGILPRELAMGVPPGTSLGTECGRQGRRSSGKSPRLPGKQARPGEDVETAAVEVGNDHTEPSDHDLHMPGTPTITVARPFEMSADS